MGEGSLVTNATVWEVGRQEDYRLLTLCCGRKEDLSQTLDSGRGEDFVTNATLLEVGREEDYNISY